MVAYAASAVCFGAAVLTKETFLLFLPALALAIWTTCVPSTRRFAIAVFGALVHLHRRASTRCSRSFAASFFAGTHHTSLLAGIGFQLSRRAAAASSTAHSADAETSSTSWLHARPDPARLRGRGDPGSARGPSSALDRRGARVCPVIVALRPGSYVPAMYVIGLLPFAALGLAALAGRSRSARAGTRRPTGCLRMVLAAGRYAVLAVPAGIAAPLWIQQGRHDAAHQRRERRRPRGRVAREHAPRNSRILVDATIWTDLVDRGFNRHRIVWFYKLDLDPSVTTPWWRFDYVVRSDLLAGEPRLAPALADRFTTTAVWRRSSRRRTSASRFGASAAISNARPVVGAPRASGQAAGLLLLIKSPAF